MALPRTRPFDQAQELRSNACNDNEILRIQNLLIAPVANQLDDEISWNDKTPKTTTGKFDWNEHCSFFNLRLSPQIRHWSVCIRAHLFRLSVWRSETILSAATQ